MLAGSKVLYGVGRGSESGSGSDLGVDLRVVTVSGGRPSTLYRFKTPSSAVDTNELGGLDADGSRWAAVRTTFTVTGDGPDSDSAPAGGDLVAGTIGKPPSRLLSSIGKEPGGCSPRRYDDPSDVAVVDGGLAVAVEPNGCLKKATIALSLGRTSVRLKGTTPRGGGRWLAYRDGDAIVVYDVKLRRASYRVAGEAGENPVVFDPQGDGKVVVQWNKGAAQRVAWYSKAENRAHDLAVTQAELGDDTFGAHVSMAADTIVMPILTGGGGLTVTSRTIFALDLTGKRTKVDDVSGASGLTGLDFDGRRVAWIDFDGVRVAPAPAR